MTIPSTMEKGLLTSKKSQALLFLLAMSISASAQKIATLEVNLDKPTAGLLVPVQVMLDPITHLHDSALMLVQLKGDKTITVPFQIESIPMRRLTWLAEGADKPLRYELIKAPIANDPMTAVSAEKKNGALTLKAGNKNLLRYQFEAMLPPRGINEVFKRSAFIHPLWSPEGRVLTRIQPPDHYHHYGLWNPWTHVLFRGDTVDFWNLNAKQGTVRFSGFMSVTSGNVFGEYEALHDHVVIRDGRETVAIREVQTVRVYAPKANANYYIADLTIKMNCPDGDVRLLEYRYGGLGWRATEEWTKENSRVLTSEGKSRKDADGSTARWCIVEGAVQGTNAGAVMMSYPGNYNHPEPLRIWPENANGGRGDMFANFAPTKNMDWQLEPGNNYVLKYRFIVFDGKLTKEQAEAGWQYFAQPPSVTVTKN